LRRQAQKRRDKHMKKTMGAVMILALFLVLYMVIGTLQMELERQNNTQEKGEAICLSREC
jgi:uncharacterized membrane protein YozB (DUF420 family)